ncbi:MAG: tetratricopeptide repeat protein [Proteobacteria bacterium]|nr:MAG: tetratricopeptide repeat protein [Pseudomonadota bacterium]
MIQASTPVALIMPTQSEISLWMSALSSCGLKKITAFTSTSEAYEVCTRQQFPLFVTRMEMPIMSGIVLIQKLRMTGNYGLEPQMFVCDKLDSRLLNVMAEYDIEYVSAAPFVPTALVDKLKHMIQIENNLDPGEALYREAKTAFSSGIVDMAEDFINELLKTNPNLEKAILLSGDIKFKNNDLEGAGNLYKKALGINPKSTTTAHKLAQLYTAQGSHEAAANLLSKLSEISPYSIKLLENAGLSNFAVERYDEAKRLMGKLSGIDTTNKVAGTVTAEIKIKNGDYDGLVETLSKSHDEKALVQFLNNAGAKLSKGDDLDGAIKMYSAAIEQITASKYLYAIHYNMGIAYKKKNDKAQALNYFKKSLKLNPTFDKAAEEIQKLGS